MKYVRRALERDLMTSLGESSVVAVECKCSSAPSVSSGTCTALDDVRPAKTIVVAPVKEGYALNERIDVVGLADLGDVL